MQRTLLLGFSALLFASGCSYDNGKVRRVYPSDAPAGASCESSADPAQSTIDVDRSLEFDPGQGAGVFVEYGAGGHWQVRTSCDTDVPGMPPCSWDVIVTPEDDSSLFNVAGADLEGGDDVRAYPDDPRSYQLRASTASDIDGLSFDSDPGAGVMVDAVLENGCGLKYFYWIGDGALHSGAPTNPLILIPSAK